MFKPQYIPPQPPVQPFPKFYIYRPDQSHIPLIPVDELPSWLTFDRIDWEDASLLNSMLPASLYPFQRDGEYDVICHNCSSNVDTLHRSVSERDDHPNAGAAPAASDLRSFSRPLWPLDLKPWPRMPTMVDQAYFPFSPLRETPLFTHLQRPVVGMCIVDNTHPPAAATPQEKEASFVPLLPPSPALTRSSEESTSDQKKQALNPEAAVFSPTLPPGDQKLPEPLTPVNPGLVGSTDLSPTLDPANADVKFEPLLPPPNTATGSPCQPAKRKYDTAMEQLKEVLRKDVCNELKPEPKPEPERIDAEVHDVEMRDATSTVSSKSKRMYSIVTDARQRRRKVKRGGKKVQARRTRNARYPKKQTTQNNPAMKRRDSRKKVSHRYNRWDCAPGSRHWHMMRIPNWRAQASAAREGGQAAGQAARKSAEESSGKIAQ